jgi:hypothetical protein
MKGLEKKEVKKLIKLNGEVNLIKYCISNSTLNLCYLTSVETLLRI